MTDDMMNLRKLLKDLTKFTAQPGILERPQPSLSGSYMRLALMAERCAGCFLEKPSCLA